MITLLYLFKKRGNCKKRRGQKREQHRAWTCMNCLRLHVELLPAMNMKYMNIWNPKKTFSKNTLRDNMMNPSQKKTSGVTASNATWIWNFLTESINPASKQDKMQLPKRDSPTDSSGKGTCETSAKVVLNLRRSNREMQPLQVKLKYMQLQLWYLGNGLLFINWSSVAGNLEVSPYLIDFNNDGESKSVVDAGILHRSSSPLWMIWFQSTAIQNKLLLLITWKLNDLEILGFNFHELWLFDSHQDVISNIFMALPRPPNNQYTSHNQHSHSLKRNDLGNLETTLLLGWWVPWRVAQYCIVLDVSLNSQAKALWKWPDTTQTQRGCNHKALDHRLQNIQLVDWSKHTALGN